MKRSDGVDDIDLVVANQNIVRVEAAQHDRRLSQTAVVLSGVFQHRRRQLRQYVTTDLVRPPQEQIRIESDTPRQLEDYCVVVQLPRNLIYHAVVRVQVS